LDLTHSLAEANEAAAEGEPLAPAELTPIQCEEEVPQADDRWTSCFFLDRYIDIVVLHVLVYLQMYFDKISTSEMYTVLY